MSRVWTRFCCVFSLKLTRGLLDVCVSFATSDGFKSETLFWGDSLSVKIAKVCEIWTLWLAWEYVYVGKLCVYVSEKMNWFQGSSSKTRVTATGVFGTHVLMSILYWTQGGSQVVVCFRMRNSEVLFQQMPVKSQQKWVIKCVENGYIYHWVLFSQDPWLIWGAIMWYALYAGWKNYKNSK